MNITALWDTAPCSLVESNQRFRVLTGSLKDKRWTVRTSETSFIYQTTRHYNPEDSHLHYSPP
jgi:hypothetical protein